MKRQMRRFVLLMSISILPASALAAEERKPLAAAGGVLDQFSNEPTIREVQEVAMRYALVNDEVLNGYQRSAKWTKVLPRTRVSYREVAEDDNNVSINEVGERDLTVEDDVATTTQVQLEWRLDEMMMGPARIQAIRESSRLVNLRDDILDEVTKIYFDRRRVQVDLLMNPPQDARTKATKDLRLEELTANLDALTGGWFSQRARAGRGK